MHTGTMYNEDKLNALIQWNEQKKVAQDIKQGNLMACAHVTARSVSKNEQVHTCCAV